MVLGVGIDLLRLSRLSRSALVPGDAFYERAFTEAERAQAHQRSDRYDYLSARFCAKEALYKAVSDCKEEFHPGDFEVLDDEDGHPHARILWRTAIAVELIWGPQVELIVSITHEDGLIGAYALAQSR